MCLNNLPVQALSVLGALQKYLLRWAVCLLWGADIRLQPSWQMSIVQDSIVVWEIPYTEDPDGLQFMESQRVGRDLGTKQQGVLIHSNRVITYLYSCP